MVGMNRYSADASPLLLVLPPTLLVLICGFVFGQVGQFEFVGYDDPIYIGDWYESRVISRGVTVEGLRWIWTASAGSLWEPLHFLSHMIDVQLWGAGPAAAGRHHLTNLLLHTVNTLLVFWLGVALFRSAAAADDSALPPATVGWTAFFAAALFAFHPLRAESVCWISERKGVLCATFVLLALLAYLRYVRGTGKSWLIVGVLLTALGMMTKPAAVVVPVLIGWLDLWPLRRCGFEAAEEDWDWIEILKRQLAEKWPYVAPAAALAAVSVLVQFGSHQEKFIGAFSLATRLYIAPANLMYYLQRTFWPTRLTIEYPPPSSHAYVWAGIVISVGLTWLAVQGGRRFPALLFGWGWFLICWLPVSGLVYVGTSFTTDRYTYLPHVGLALAIVYQLAVWCRPWKAAYRIVALVAGLLLVAASSLACYRQAASWQNNFTLFQQAIDAQPRSRLGYVNLAVALERTGQPTKAIELLEQVVAMQPDYVAYYNLGRLYGEELADVAEAKRMYAECLKINPNYTAALHNQGIIYLREQKFEEALQHVQRASQGVNHQQPLYLNTLADVLLKLNRPREALAACRRASQLPIKDERLKAALQEKTRALQPFRELPRP